MFSIAANPTLGNWNAAPVISTAKPRDWSVTSSPVVYSPPSYPTPSYMNVPAGVYVPEQKRWIPKPKYPASAPVGSPPIGVEEYAEVL